MSIQFYTMTCTNPDCVAFGVPRYLDLGPILDANADSDPPITDPPSVFCGDCGTEYTDVVPVAAEDVPNPLPIPDETEEGL